MFVSLAFLAACGKRVTARVPPPAAKPVPPGWTETGIASWYGVPYDGRRAASGEIFDTKKLTAAHRTLPFDTWVEVTNLENHKRVEVRINDRGPFVDGRIIDLSFAAADRIDVVRPGTAKVRLKVIRAPKIEDAASAAAPAVAPAVFCVQAGAFSDLDRAEELRARLARDARLSGFPARILQTASLARVLVGTGLTREAADSLAAEIRKTGIEAIVVRDPAAALPGGN